MFEKKIINYLPFYLEDGDHVVCTNCNGNFLVPNGLDHCPRCEKDGSLMWASDAPQFSSMKGIQEANLIELMELGYEIENHPDAQFLEKLRHQVVYEDW